MAQKTGFMDYLAAAFNARPIGMFVAPNWVGLAAFGLLGLTNPGFWVLGAGLELGYLLTLATNPRFQRTHRVAPACRPRTPSGTRAFEASPAGSTRAIGAATRRCRSGAGRSSTCRRTAARTCRTASRRRPTASAASRGCSCACSSRAARSGPCSATARTARRSRRRWRRSSARRATSRWRRICGAAWPGRSRSSASASSSATEAQRKLAYIDAELTRIEQQVELIREQAALSTDPEVLSRRIDEIAATLGGTGQWIRDQQQVYGAMEDLLTEPPPLAADARAKESQ